jgi:citrate synthase
MSLTLYSRAKTMPKNVEKLIRSLPKTMHPMTQLSIGLMALQEDSHFFTAYNEGVRKQDLWKATYEDALDLIARIPIIAALIYQVKFKQGRLPQMDPNLDWAANYGLMLGYEDTKFHELMRLYMFLHCDHEGGNVSAHATHLVGSALSDPYISFAAGVNGLAGPLHGAANAETLKFLLEIVNVYGERPTKEQVIQFVHEILDGGRVIPGYGHAVLKKTDPRFTS